MIAKVSGVVAPFCPLVPLDGAPGRVRKAAKRHRPLLPVAALCDRRICKSVQRALPQGSPRERRRLVAAAADHVLYAAQERHIVRKALAGAPERLDLERRRGDLYTLQVQRPKRLERARLRFACFAFSLCFPVSVRLSPSSAPRARARAPRWRLPTLVVAPPGCLGLFGDLLLSIFRYPLQIRAAPLRPCGPHSR